jgi:phosphatidylinositol-3-phosphatase
VSAIRSRLVLVGRCGLAAVAFGSCGHANPGPPLSVAVSQVPRSTSSHVVTVVMENHEADAIIGSGEAPYFNRLARRAGLALRSYGIRHPSLPNYLALTSGSTHGIDSDCTDCPVGGRSIVDQLEAARISWRAYMQDMPTPCFLDANAGGYAKRHDPFVYYVRVARDPRRCRRVVPWRQLAVDLRRGRLPTYAFISPNLCNDTHDCPIATGDRFLARLVPLLLRQLGPHGFLVLTWDEGDTDRGCCGVAHGGRIATLVAGPDVRRGARDRRPVDHYGVLRTTEDALRVPRLGGAAQARNGTLRGLFARAPRVR